MEEVGALLSSPSFSVLPLHFTPQDGLHQDGPQLYCGVLCWKQEGVRDTVLRADQGKQEWWWSVWEVRAGGENRSFEASRPRKVASRLCCHDYHPAHMLRNPSFE